MTSTSSSHSPSSPSIDSLASFEQDDSYSPPPAQRRRNSTSVLHSPLRVAATKLSSSHHDTAAASASTATANAARNKPSGTSQSTNMPSPPYEKATPELTHASSSNSRCQQRPNSPKRASSHSDKTTSAKGVSKAKAAASVATTVYDDGIRVRPVDESYSAKVDKDCTEEEEIAAAPAKTDSDGIRVFSEKEEVAAHSSSTAVETSRDDDGIRIYTEAPDHSVPTTSNGNYPEPQQQQQQLVPAAPRSMVAPPPPPPPPPPPRHLQVATANHNDNTYHAHSAPPHHLHHQPNMAHYYNAQYPHGHSYPQPQGAYYSHPSYQTPYPNYPMVDHDGIRVYADQQQQHDNYAAQSHKAPIAATPKDDNAGIRVYAAPEGALKVARPNAFVKPAPIRAPPPPIDPTTGLQSGHPALQPVKPPQRKVVKSKAAPVKRSNSSKSCKEKEADEPVKAAAKPVEACNAMPVGSDHSDDNAKPKKKGMLKKLMGSLTRHKSRDSLPSSNKRPPIRRGSSVELSSNEFSKAPSSASSVSTKSEPIVSQVEAQETLVPINPDSQQVHVVDPADADSEPSPVLAETPSETAPTQSNMEMTAPPRPFLGSALSVRSFGLDRSNRSFRQQSPASQPRTPIVSSNSPGNHSASQRQAFVRRTDSLRSIGMDKSDRSGRPVIPRRAVSPSTRPRLESRPDSCSTIGLDKSDRSRRVASAPAPDVHNSIDGNSPSDIPSSVIIERPPYGTQRPNSSKSLGLDSSDHSPRQQQLPMGPAMNPPHRQAGGGMPQPQLRRIGSGEFPRPHAQQAAMMPGMKPQFASMGPQPHGMPGRQSLSSAMFLQQQQQQQQQQQPHHPLQKPTMGTRHSFHSGLAMGGAPQQLQQRGAAPMGRSLSAVYPGQRPMQQQSQQNFVWAQPAMPPPMQQAGGGCATCPCCLNNQMIQHYQGHPMAAAARGGPQPLRASPHGGPLSLNQRPSTLTRQPSSNSFQQRAILHHGNSHPMHPNGSPKSMHPNGAPQPMPPNGSQPMRQNVVQPIQLNGSQVMQPNGSQPLHPNSSQLIHPNNLGRSNSMGSPRRGFKPMMAGPSYCMPANDSHFGPDTRVATGPPNFATHAGPQPGGPGGNPTRTMPRTMSYGPTAFGTQPRRPLIDQDCQSVATSRSRAPMRSNPMIVHPSQPSQQKSHFNSATTTRMPGIGYPSGHPMLSDNISTASTQRMGTRTPMPLKQGQQPLRRTSSAIPKSNSAGSMQELARGSAHGGTRVGPVGAAYAPNETFQHSSNHGPIYVESNPQVGPSRPAIRAHQSARY